MPDPSANPVPQSPLHRAVGFVAAHPVMQRWGRELVVVLALLIVLATPFLLKPKDSVAPTHYDRRLVIITPHNEKIRQEFGSAFARHWKEKTGQSVYVDWRVPGGTSEIAMFLRSEYAAAFQNHWENKLHQTWTREVAGAFGNGKIKLPEAAGAKLDAAQSARKQFLDSKVGIGIDLFFGGGAFDFQGQASAGLLVPTRIFSQHPDWFKEEIIPASLSGEPFYDPGKRWVGSCLSSLGIVYNRDVLKRLHVDKEPAQWADLANPKLINQVALSDPNKSGTVSKALEQLIQQQMILAIEELKKAPPQFKSEKEIEAMGVRKGWENGLRLIQRIGANSRYFSDAATKIPLEVAQGDAAAGMCIDFYGRSFEEQTRKQDGSTRVSFVAPLGGSSVGVDPVALMRGAPEPELAESFIEFVLSEQGQKLWNYQPGVPGGPKQAALRRLPVRRDFYDGTHAALMTDAGSKPYEDAKAFTYHPEWTGSLFNAIRFLVKVMCIEPHDEAQRAWKMISSRDFPPMATGVFGDIGLVGYDKALSIASDLGKKDKELEIAMEREMSGLFRRQYERAYELAKEGQ